MTADKYRMIAETILEETGDEGAIVEDAVSVCAYWSRSHGQELTLDEGRKVRDWLDDLRTIHDNEEDWWDEL